MIAIVDAESGLVMNTVRYLIKHTDNGHWTDKTSSQPMGMADVANTELCLVFELSTRGAQCRHTVNIALISHAVTKSCNGPDSNKNKAPHRTDGCLLLLP